ncbi:MAG TPA: arsenic transporter [Rhodoblastus sp.]|nr:arsenic transporter [Rhodoblastus sp.]
MSGAALATLGIVVATILGVLARPFRLPEYVFAIVGAAALLAFGLLSPAAAWSAAAKGYDVYLFLVGMMLLAEVARQEGLFDWIAGHAAHAARGSARRLFALVYGVGVLVTVFLSNDATAVVLTPAVYAVARAAGVEPLPYLFICAFIANAASFVLPISNPANLVVYGERLPALLPWIRTFALPSLVAIAATYAALRWTQRRALAKPLAPAPEVEPLSPAGRAAGVTLALAALILVGASALGCDLGLPTLACGIVSMLAASLIALRSPLPVLRHVAWGVLPLVAGLFVLVAGLEHVGGIRLIADWLSAHDKAAPGQTAFFAGLAAGFGANVVNNLPLGLLAGAAGQAAQAPDKVVAGLLIGVDLGPNLSVTGSLATLLWLLAIRREGEHVGALRFLGLGALAMPPALLLSLAALVLL